MFSLIQQTLAEILGLTFCATPGDTLATKTVGPGRGQGTAWEAVPRAKPTRGQT